MIGRIAPEKRIERAIEILENVRKRGHSVQLHLCGPIENDPYGRRISGLCRERSDWIILEGGVTGAKKTAILSHSQFGIQTSSAEGFGISVAEMVKAGAIVFASDGGGQTEVIDNPDLLFSGVDDAAEKICAALSDPEKQRALRAHLAPRSEMFSTGRFMEAARAHVKKAALDFQSAQRPANRRKVVIGHPKLGYGGSESTMMWLIEALKSDFDVTVMTTGGWDLPALNLYYGTNVRQDDVKVRIAPLPFLAHSLNAAALRGACFQNFARQIADEYEIRISAYNPTDWGLPATHFIADFSWNPEIREKFHPAPPGFIYRKSLIRWAYLKIAAAYGRPSGRDVLRDDELIANSHWTAALIKQQCGVESAEVVYPPVGIEFSSVPWEEKELSFVMIGRIAPEKRIERAIEILERVRQRGHPVKLRICGPIENDPYGRRIAILSYKHSDWIILEGGVTGARKAQILSHSRFGIQTSSAEGFGISVAEMVKAGAVVFASDDGGADGSHRPPRPAFLRCRRCRGQNLRHTLQS
jgi:glycosyltransferase involved in cell wall biosynthesis